jgi:hypothetical protein
LPADPLPERREPERKAKSGPQSGLVFVVSRDALDHYENLKRAFADDAKVAVILDRRSRERRKTPNTRSAERRRTDRRSRPLIDDRLRRQGRAMVRLGADRGFSMDSER